MLARLPRKYLIAGDQVVPYLVIFNSHDGSSGVKVAMTPIRVVCQNTLNLALNAKRMKRLISTLNLSKEDWLRYRKCGITGTDAGAILGLNPYRSAFQVYCDKNSETIENIDNEAMRQGRDLEDYVAQRFTETTGLKVRRANAIYQSEEHPLLLADFDRLIVGQKAGLECKTVSPFSADKWADGKIPAHYMAQVNHYLAVSGFDCWYIAALIFGRNW